jgi:hypothetical protein
MRDGPAVPSGFSPGGGFGASTESTARMVAVDDPDFVNADRRFRRELLFVQ